MAQSDSADSFMTVAEVAGILKLNQQTVRNWIDQGSLPALRVGRRVRIRRSDFERILEEGYTGASGPSGQVSRPTAEDFWGGDAVGAAAPAPERRASGQASATERRASGHAPAPEGRVGGSAQASENPAAGNGHAA
jgi:excisionase family DNA binding protein